MSSGQLTNATFTIREKRLTYVPNIQNGLLCTKKETNCVLFIR